MIYTATVEPTTTLNITCAEGFYISNGTCLPSCHSWNQNGEAYTTLLFVMQLLSSLLAVVASSTLYVVSFFRYKSMYL